MIAPVTSFPPPETDLAWSVATERVKSYLRAHGVTRSEQISRLAADVVAIARTRHRRGVDPTALAMETLEACMRSWFARMLPSDDANPAHLLTRGRVALASGEVPARWPDHFLRDGAVPAELVRAMRGAELGGPPEIRLSHMAPPKSATLPGRGRGRTLQRATTVVRMVVSVIGAALTGGL